VDIGKLELMNPELDVSDTDNGELVPLVMLKVGLWVGGPGPPPFLGLNLFQSVRGNQER